MRVQCSLQIFTNQIVVGNFCHFGDSPFHTFAAHQIVKFMSEKKIFEKPVTAKHICKMIGVSRPSLHRWTKIGKVRSHKVGGKLLFFESEIMEDLKRC